MERCLFVSSFVLFVSTSTSLEINDTKLFDKVAQLEENIGVHVSAENVSLTDYDDYETQVVYLRKILAEQISQTKVLAKHIERHDEVISDLVRNCQLKESVNCASAEGNKNSHMEKRQLQPEVVAFTAYLNVSADHLGINQVIPYNAIITNIGNGFDAHTNIFTCPVSGLYLFTFTVSEYSPTSGKEIVAKLVVDGKNTVDGIANTVTAYHDQQGGNTAVLQLTVGQTVWVASYYQKDTFIRSEPAYRFSTFSGVMLQSL